MVVEITAQGKTAAEAMSNLKSPRAAEAKLADLSASKIRSSAAERVSASI